MISLRKLLPLLALISCLGSLYLPGCDTLITEVNEFTIAGHPTAEFGIDSLSVDSGCTPLTVGFVDKSTGPHQSWLWRFGDGDSSLDTNPVHIYDSAGTYTVMLTILDTTVDDEPGADIEVKNRYIIVGTTVDSFSADLVKGCPGMEVSFTPVDYGGITSYSWNFGDSSSLVSDSNPTHTYDSTGIYACTLTVTGGCGTKVIGYDSLITVLDCPEARIGSNLRVICQNDDEVQFIDSTDYSVLGEPTYRLWNFGESDEDTSSSPTPTKVYSTPGKYTVKLTVTTDDGIGGDVTVTDSIEDYMTVYGPSTAQVGAVSATSGCVNPLYRFQVKFKIDSMNAVDSFHYTKLIWYFGDSTPPTDPDVDPHPMSPVHTYEEPGVYDVTLIAWTQCADSTATTTVGFVQLSGPLQDDSAWFTIDSSYFVNVDTLIDTIIDTLVDPPDTTFDSTYNIIDSTLTFVFQDSSQGFVDRWEWDFGDDSTGTGDSVGHTYTVFDTLDVTMLIINDCNSASVTRTIIVEEPPAGVAARRRYGMPDK